MNKTKIEWCDASWNVITGCNNRCSFCYAHKIAMRFTGHFKPAFHKDRLDEPKKENRPLRIFADSMSDFWSKGVKQEWRNKIWDVMLDTPRHTYYVLTKRPDRMTKTDLKRMPQNCFVGVSVAVFSDRWRIGMLISKLGKHNSFVSIEPCLDDAISDYVYLCDWIIVGGLTGIKNPFRPKKRTIDGLIKDCRRLKKPLFLKDNLGYPKQIREFPEQKKEISAHDVHRTA